MVVWIKFIDLDFNTDFLYDNMLEFANAGPSINNVVEFYVCQGKIFSNEIVEGGNLNGSYIEITSPSAKSTFELNKWYQFAYTLEKTMAYLYVNGVLAIKGIQTTILSKTIRKNNFIGQSNYVDKNINAIYDDIKIYEEAIPE